MPTTLGDFDDQFFETEKKGLNWQGKVEGSVDIFKSRASN